jgi:hypothetical protein
VRCTLLLHRVAHWTERPSKTEGCARILTFGLDVLRGKKKALAEECKCGWMMC